MKNKIALCSEDIIDMRSEVESITLLKTACGTFREEETEEDIAEFASSWESEESADFEIERGCKTEREARTVSGLELQPREYQIDDAILMYLRDIRRIPLLTANDEKTLASKLEEAKYLTKIEGLQFHRYNRYPIKDRLVNDYI
jgi:DNA-directed RNA polymerase sigma subunit (sigma70/sigma32)